MIQLTVPRPENEKKPKRSPLKHTESNEIKKAKAPFRKPQKRKDFKAACMLGGIDYRIETVPLYRIFFYLKCRHAMGRIQIKVPSTWQIEKEHILDKNCSQPIETFRLRISAFGNQ